MGEKERDHAGADHYSFALRALRAAFCVLTFLQGEEGLFWSPASVPAAVPAGVLEDCLSFPLEAAPGSRASFFPGVVISERSNLPPTQNLHPLPSETEPPPLVHSLSVIAKTPDVKKRLANRKHVETMILSVAVFVIRFSLYLIMICCSINN